MNLHEYQAKALLKKYGVPVQEGILATNAEKQSLHLNSLAVNLP
jgi:succinyl-CoA synthetase beta subunit